MPTLPESRLRSQPKRRLVQGSAKPSASPASAVIASRSSPIGATVLKGGVNFSVFSRHATAVELLLFDRAEDAKPSRVINVDPLRNHTYHYWHTFVPGLKAAQIYAYRVAGPFEPERRCCSKGLLPRRR